MKNNYIIENGIKKFIARPGNPHPYGPIHSYYYGIEKRREVYTDIKSWYKNRFDEDVNVDNLISRNHVAYAGYYVINNSIMGVTKNYIYTINGRDGVNATWYGNTNKHIYGRKDANNNFGVITDTHIHAGWFLGEKYMYHDTDENIEGTYNIVSQYYATSPGANLLYRFINGIRYDSYPYNSINDHYSPYLTSPVCGNLKYLFVISYSYVGVFEKSGTSFIYKGRFKKKYSVPYEGRDCDANSKYLYLTDYRYNHISRYDIENLDSLVSADTISNTDLIDITATNFDCSVSTNSCYIKNYNPQNSYFACDEEFTYINAKFYTSNINSWSGPVAEQMTTYVRDLDLNDTTNIPIDLSAPGGGYSGAEKFTFNESSSVNYTISSNVTVKKVSIGEGVDEIEFTQAEDGSLVFTQVADEDSRYPQGHIKVIQKSDTNIQIQSIGNGGQYNINIYFENTIYNIIIETPLIIYCTINAVNDAPIMISVQKDEEEADIIEDLTNPPTYTINEEDVLKVKVDAKDEETPTSDLTFTLTGAGSLVTISAFDTTTNQFTITGIKDKHGTATMTATVRDPSGLTNSYTFNILVNEVNDAPITVDRSFTTNEDTVLNESLGFSDPSDPGDTTEPHEYILVDDVTVGELTFSADGSFIYKPEPNWNSGPSNGDIVTFTYKVKDRIDSDDSLDSNTSTVSITVVSVNDLPEIVLWPDNIEGKQGKTDIFTVIGQDVEDSLNSLDITITSSRIESSTYLGDGQVEVTFNNEPGADKALITVTDRNGAKDSKEVPLFNEFDWSGEGNVVKDLETIQEYVVKSNIYSFKMFKLTELEKMDFVNGKIGLPIIRDRHIIFEENITDFIYDKKPSYDFTKINITENYVVNDILEDGDCFIIQWYPFVKDNIFKTTHNFTEEQAQAINFNSPKSINCRNFKFNDREYQFMDNIDYVVNGVNIRYENTAMDPNETPVYDTDEIMVGYKKDGKLYLDRFY